MTESSNLNVVVVDDHQLFAEAMASVAVKLDVKSSVSVFTNAQDALSFIKKEKPDLCLVDLCMPEIDGFSLIPKIQQSSMLSSIIIVSASLDRHDMRYAFELGAVGYIPKSASPEIIKSAVQLVLAGGVYIPPQLVELQPVKRPGRAGKSAGVLAILTPRQREVLALVDKGFSNKEIARGLGCTEATVKAHVAAILKALNVSNRTEATHAVRGLELQAYVPAAKA
ncbi:response regulator transcription factor [Microbulbifer sp. HZ11]|uniref:response regulator n=1 Tax=Microbulbifer sp. HZ11 TaxID=1453501 RepID=UPI0005B95317|nr:response regulator transcription factor [Microbulbifer sp. HZ11]